MTQDHLRPEPGAFKTLATTAEGVLADLYKYGRELLREAGILPPTAGITKNRPPAAQREGGPIDLLGSVDGLVQDATNQKGPRALDHPIHPHDTYRQRRYDFIKQHEGVRSRAYDDATGRSIAPGVEKSGLVTVGIGFNMERPDARRVWARVFGDDGPNFDEVFAGRAKLNGAQTKKLFDHTAQEAEDFVSNRFRGVDLREHERIALVSLAFNNPSLVGPNLTRLIKDGDRQGAREEILWKSNRKKHKGLANRRWHEAAMFVGMADAFSALPPHSEYMKNFG